MPSFDIVSEVDWVEVRNAIDQANREIDTRFDFKGTASKVELSDKDMVIHTNDEFRLKQAIDILSGKFTKRGVDIRSLEYGKIESVSGNRVKQTVKIRVGLDTDMAKKIVKALKEEKSLKVQGAIQGDAVRVSGAKRDNLQEAIALVKKLITDYPLQFINFRE